MLEWGPWVSLVAQLIKNLPAMQETRVQSLGWEDSLEKGKATYSSILAWRIPWQPDWYRNWGSWTDCSVITQLCNLVATELTKDHDFLIKNLCL